jgi:hypothetical protein
VDYAPEFDTAHVDYDAQRAARKNREAKAGVGGETRRKERLAPVLKVA